DRVPPEVPAVAPIDLGTGGTLSEIEGIFYAAFPKVRGRSLDELDAENRRRIGRTTGRPQEGGAPRRGADRVWLLPGASFPGGRAPRSRDVAGGIAEASAKPLAAARVQRIHRDL